MSVSIADSASSSLHSDHDPISNIVKLKLKKPKSWNWELSTSKSSPHICFPHIFLYDDKNNLLADTNEANCVINGVTGSNQSLNGSKTSIFAKNDNKTKLRRSSSKSDRSHIINSTELIDCTEESPSPVSVHRSDSDTSQYRKCKRSVSTSSCGVTEFLEEFVSDLKRQGIDCKVRRKSSTDRSNQRRHSIKLNESNENDVQSKIAEQSVSSAKTEIGNSNVDVIEQTTPRPPEVPIMIYSARGLVQRDLNAKEFDAIRNRNQIHQCKSTSNLSENSRNEAVVNHVNDADINSNSEKLVPTDSGKHTNAKINRPKPGIQKSKSALAVPSHGMGEQVNEKRKTRRVHSAKTGTFDSTSYLERLSYFKRRSSSTDSQALDEFPQFAEVYNNSQPKYRLQSSPAGTLVVCKESFQNRRVRRRPRKCSNIYEEEEPLMCPEKVVHKFTYNGDVENANKVCTATDRHIFKRSFSQKGDAAKDTYNHNDKFPSRYEKAIENIDSLISKVILLHTEPCLNKTEQMNYDASKFPDDVENSITNENLATVQSTIVNSTVDSAFDGNSISDLIKNSRDNANVLADGNSSGCNGNANNTTADADATTTTITNNNTSVKQKKCKRKISFSHNNSDVNNWLAPNGSRDNTDCNETLKSAKNSLDRKIRRSASAGSDRFHLSSSDNDIGINGQNNGVDNGSNGRRSRQRNRRQAAATRTTAESNSLSPNGE